MGLNCFTVLKGAPEIGKLSIIFHFQQFFCRKLLSCVRTALQKSMLKIDNLCHNTMILLVPVRLFICFKVTFSLTVQHVPTFDVRSFVKLTLTNILCSSDIHHENIILIMLVGEFMSCVQHTLLLDQYSLSKFLVKQKLFYIYMFHSGVSRSS